MHKLLAKLAEVQQLDRVQDLHNMHTRAVLADLKENYTVWTQHSLERHIFDTLLMECGESSASSLVRFIQYREQNIKNLCLTIVFLKQDDSSNNINKLTCCFYSS